MKQIDWADLEKDIFPIFVIDEKTTPDATSCVGTGFLVRDNVALTCHHCISEKLVGSQYYAAIIRVDGEHRAFKLENILRKPEGIDVAVARIDRNQTIAIPLGTEGAPAGTDVSIFGYPFTDKELKHDGKLEFGINPRFLKTYITRAFWYEHSGYNKTLAYEIGIAAPQGLSGSPIIDSKSKRVLGMIFGNIDTYTIIDTETITKDDEERVLETRQVVSFGLGHHTDVLLRILDGYK